MSQKIRKNNDKLFIKYMIIVLCVYNKYMLTENNSIYFVVFHIAILKFSYRIQLIMINPLVHKVIVFLLNRLSVYFSSKYNYIAPNCYFPISSS